MYLGLSYKQIQALSKHKGFTKTTQIANIIEKEINTSHLKVHQFKVPMKDLATHTTAFQNTINRVRHN